MNIGEAVRKCYYKSFNATGCAERDEFWLFFVFKIAGVLACAFAGSLFANIIGAREFMAYFMLTLIGIFYLTTIPATICVTIRRLHDTGKSGFYILFGLIPYLGSLIIYILALQRSEPTSAYRVKEEDDEDF